MLASNARCSHILSAIVVIAALVTRKQVAARNLLQSDAPIADDNSWPTRAGVCGNHIWDMRIRERVSDEEVQRRLRVYTDVVGRQQPDNLPPADLVIVRLNIVYDNSIAIKMGSTERLIQYLRNLFYQTQLNFEKPELWSQMKIMLRVTSIIPSSTKYDSMKFADGVLADFGKSDDIADATKADLNILVMYRDMWATPETVQIKVLGIANIFTFCNVQTPLHIRTMIVTGASLAMSYVVAHELTHALGVFHDGSPFPIESQCPGQGSLMSPFADSTNLDWSGCSVAKLINNFSMEHIRLCINDMNRRLTPAYDKRFDWWPQDPSVNPARAPLPGQQEGLDEQCHSIFGPRFVSLPFTAWQPKPQFETCQLHMCVTVDTFYHIVQGPAPSGSECKIIRSQTDVGKIGTCFNSRCIP